MSTPRGLTAANITERSKYDREALGLKAKVRNRPPRAGLYGVSDSCRRTSVWDRRQKGCFGGAERVETRDGLMRRIDFEVLGGS